MGKKTIVFLALIFFLAISKNIAYAFSQNEVLILAAEDYVRSPRVHDVIVYKYRMYYGVLQYRRWNETQGYWVDSSWINAN